MPGTWSAFLSGAGISIPTLNSTRLFQPPTPSNGPGGGQVKWHRALQEGGALAGAGLEPHVLTCQPCGGGGEMRIRLTGALSVWGSQLVCYCSQGVVPLPLSLFLFILF